MALTVSDAPVELPAGPAPAAPESTRRSTPIVGVVLAIAAGTMFFGALLGHFFAAQDAADVWPPEGVSLPNVALAVAYFTLLLASVTAQWAAAAIEQNERRHMYLAIGLTLLFGAAFLNAQAFIWREMGLIAGSEEHGEYANTVYALTVSHAVAVVGAIVLFVVMGFRALGGQFRPRNAEFVQAAAYFWHFVVAIGAVIWFLLWFLEGGPRG